MELISKEEVIKITKKYDTTIYDAAMWCRKEIEELKTYTPLEQENVLDKIRAEIEQMDFDFGDFYDHTYVIREMVLEVIDRYRAKTEEGADNGTD